MVNPKSLFESELNLTVFEVVEMDFLDIVFASMFRSKPVT